MKKMKVIIVLVLMIFMVNSKDDEEKKETISGDSIGINLTHSNATTKAMKRPLKWFFNMITQKPSRKYFQEAEYNGLRYQTEQLRNNLDKEYEGYKREFYDQKLKNYEQIKINELNLRKRIYNK
jgi:hypothetical protein